MSKEEQLKNIIAEQFGVDLKDVALDKNFVDDFGADSLDFVELIMKCEDEFDIEIKDEEAETIKTVQEALGFIKGRKEKP